MKTMSKLGSLDRGEMGSILKGIKYIYNFLIFNYLFPFSNNSVNPYFNSQKTTEKGFLKKKGF
jgi:hypothetical protein